MAHAIRILALGALCLCNVSASMGQELQFEKGRPTESLDQAAAKAVTVRLISENDALIPGRTATIALAVDIAPGWYLYWHNPGDSGLPISWEIDAPAALSIGEAMWPAPRRYITGGVILDYTYENKVTILIPIELASDQAIGTSVRLRAKVSWLVCREGCVPGGGEAILAMPVAPVAKPGVDAQRIIEARSELPLPSADFVKAGGSTDWKNQILTIQFENADSLEFYPYASETAIPEKLIGKGTDSGPSLAIPYRASVRKAHRVQGVLRVNRDGLIRYYVVDVSPPPP